MAKKKIKLITLGCSKNLVDSQVMMRQLKENGLACVDEDYEGYVDIVLINTCGFIHDAKEESIDVILQQAEARQEGRAGELIVTGCLSERYKDELRDEIPEVDAFFGVDQLEAVLLKLKSTYRPELLDQRVLSGPGHYAYLKIAEGCDRKCAFCAIPQIRGPYRSKSIEQLKREAELLAAEGVKELLLIAQDLNWYGTDNYKKQALGPLLDELVQVDGVEWLRLHYTYPAGFPMEVIDRMAAQEKICNYLDIPFQHVSDKVLKAMKRGHSHAQAYELIGQVRRKVPGVALRTTLMTGFPGEGEDDFRQLMDFVRQVRFERLGVFAYSHEEGTPAWRDHEDSIPQEVKEERVSELMALQQDISLEINQAKVGKVFKMIVDRTDGEFYYGRTEHDSPEVDNEVLVPVKGKAMEVGTFMEVRITGADEFDLYGELSG